MVNLFYEFVLSRMYLKSTYYENIGRHALGQ